MLRSTCFQRITALMLVATILQLPGCAVKPPTEVTPQPPPLKTTQQSTGGGSPGVTVIPQPSTLALAEGVDLYNQGQFQAAIRKLQDTPDIWTNTPAIQVEGFKYLAFSQCVIRQTSQCRQSFERLLNLAPSFELSRAEAGHPLWGPVFRAAQQAGRKSVRP